MAEVEKDPFPFDAPAKQSFPFLEVTCKRSGKITRFAWGTEAGFAVNFINKKSEADGDSGIPLVSYVEAVKEGELPVTFGPNAPLVNYGPGWKLQTVNDSEVATVSGAKGINVGARRLHRVEKVTDDSNCLQKESQPVISLFYIGKILLAFLFIFIFGAIFTLFLENLPQLILYLNSSV